MVLETYRSKRHFKTTPEPAGEEPAAAPGHSFVVQKHDARRLHYDFRLEMAGVLKSWAITRGPSLIPGEKRLAVHVEDHPLAYGVFEGTIPKGEYGGGTVILWDRGQWTPIGDAAKGYAKGHLDFELAGEKLRGRWHLVRMKGASRDKHDNWLLIKGDDDAARRDIDILAQRPESVKTGRDIPEVAGEAPGWSSQRGKLSPPAPLPDFIPPALATLVTKSPTGNRWLHEIKFDGYRLAARIENGQVRLFTRSGLDWTGRFGPDLVAALQALPAGTALIDGELVVESGNGASDFSALQADLSAGRSDRFVYYAFDLLFQDGADLRALPLVERKAKLQQLLAAAPGIIRISESFDQNGDLILHHACRLGLEGIVSKLRASPYRSGRGRDWVKSKCAERQEFVVAGYTSSTAAADAIGSLVLGYYQNDRLVHAGRTGTGFTAAVARDLFRRLESLRAPASPFADRMTADAARNVRYVRPELVAEVEFRGWTAERSLRHASFRGLREDKPAREVIEEQPIAPPDPQPRAQNALTHPDRVYWPEASVTKQALLDYYAQAWRLMAPFVTGRPLALLRCPDGIGQACFFQKHAWKGASKHLRLAADPRDPSGDKLIAIDDFDGLAGLVQGGVLEIHPWGSTLKALDQPDLIIFDLDPGPGVAWPAVIAAAQEVRARLARHGLAAFVKTSGGKGLHVVAPLIPRASWDEVKPFTKTLADAMAADSPNRYVAVATKAKRDGKIYLDYLRNGRGATAVAPYSPRARPEAGISMPLAWEELRENITASHFNLTNPAARLAEQGSPWGEFWQAAAAIDKG